VPARRRPSAGKAAVLRVRVRCRRRYAGHLRWGLAVGRSESLHQLGRIDAKTGRDLEQVVEAQVALSSLDLAQEGPVDAGLVGQGFLAEVQGFPLGTDSFTQGGRGRREWLSHRLPNDIRPKLLCPESLRLMLLRPGMVPPIHIQGHGCRAQGHELSKEVRRSMLTLTFLVQRCRSRGVPLVLVGLVVVGLQGCGSGASSMTSATSSLPGVVASTDPTASTPAPETSDTSAAEPNTEGPASFVVNATTQEGDQVKVEGWFGPALPASESDVDQSALSECPPPAPDGRAIVVRLDLTATLESSLSGKVGLETSFIPETSGTHQLVNFVMGYSQGASCVRGEPGATSINLGTLQPQQATNFTMWVILPDAVTPDNPKPSEKTLGAEHWFMAIPQPTVNESGSAQDQHDRVSGPRVVHCHNGDNPSEPGAEYIAVVGRTPTTILESVCPTP
jgi:hypothetical protein